MRVAGKTVVRSDARLLGSIQQLGLSRVLTHRVVIDALVRIMRVLAESLPTGVSASTMETTP
jgi:hypothetical protein